MLGSKINEIIKSNIGCGSLIENLETKGKVLEPSLQSNCNLLSNNEVASKNMKPKSKFLLSIN
jgi:hypothetical protein